MLGVWWVLSYFHVSFPKTKLSCRAVRVCHVTQDALVHGLENAAHVLHLWVASPRVEGSGVGQKFGWGQRMGREKNAGTNPHLNFVRTHPQIMLDL